MTESTEPAPAAPAPAPAAEAEADPPAPRGRWRRRILAGVAIVVVAALAVATPFVLQLARVGTGYGAKILCSGTFVSERPPERVFAEDLEPIAGFASFEVDREARTATVSIGPVSRTAVFRPGLGATLVLGEHDAAALRAVPAPPAPGGLDESRPWPVGDALPPDASGAAEAAGVDIARIEAALDEAFAEPGPKPRRTRAVVVVHDGTIIAERYAEGIDAETRLTGWSMTKSLTATLVGILVRDGKLDIHQPAGLPEWSADGDPRAKITLDQLLRMSSGLRFVEEYGDPFCDVVQMLFTRPSAARYASALPADAEPDAVWSYSSGTTNVIQRVIRRAVGDDAAYHALPRRELFDRIGMKSAIMETDPDGTFVGSSFSWASARDWARFGLLSLEDGVWQGERILPEGWVTYCTTPTPKAPGGRYGAQWWLNAGEGGDPETRPAPELPADFYSARGYQGQSVCIIPSRRLVVVRLGCTEARGAFDLQAMLVEIIAAVDEAG